MMSPGTRSRSGISARLAVAEDGGGDVNHGLELGGGGVGAGFLDEAEGDAQDDHGSHDGAGAGVAGGEGNRREDGQQDYQGVADNFQEADEPALGAFLRDFIRT